MNAKRKRILFLGTPEISARLLEAMIQDNYNIVGVVTKVDAPVGRKMVLTATPVKIVAEKHQIPVFQFTKIREGIETLASLKADVIVCLAYGQIVPESLLQLMTIGSLNFHGSLLPKYRGAAPLQRAIMNGERISGVTAMEMVKEMDAGVMYGKLEIPIADTDTFSTYREKFIEQVIPFALDILPKYLKQEIVGEPQNTKEATFANMISKDETHLDICSTADDFVNKVRGLSEEPGGYLDNNGTKLKIFFARKISAIVTTIPGVIIRSDVNGIVMQLADGEVCLDVLQLPGKRKLNYKDFVNGNRDFAGTRLK